MILILNKELAVISYEADNLTDDKKALPAFLTVVLVVGCIIAIVRIIINIADMKQIASERKAYKRKKEIDVNILV